MFKQLEEHKEVIPDGKLAAQFLTHWRRSVMRFVVGAARMKEIPEIFVFPGPKPKKCFTPPPDYRSESEEESEDEYDDEDDEDEDEESEGEDGVVKSSYKVKDEFLEQVRYFC